MRYGGTPQHILVRRVAKNDWLLGLILGFLSPIVAAFFLFFPVPQCRVLCRYCAARAYAYSCGDTHTARTYAHANNSGGAAYAYSVA